MLKSLALISDPKIASRASWGLVLDFKIWFPKKWFPKIWFLNQKMVSQSKNGFSIKK